MHFYNDWFSSLEEVVACLRHPGMVERVVAIFEAGPMCGGKSLFKSMPTQIVYPAGVPCRGPSTDVCAEATLRATR
eukprot:12931587-Prorocentrum_lima.AAC.1